MARGRALLRNYTPTPEPEPPREVRLPPMRGNQTMSAPARPDLRRDVQSARAPAPVAEPVPLAVLGARPMKAVREGRSSATLVPSAFDEQTMTPRVTADEPWFADEDLDLDGGHTMDDVMTADDTITELPRVLDSMVELGVFFAGLATGLAVQGTLAWVAWTMVVG